MSPIEHRLSGHNATLAGLTRLIDRQLDKGALERIELRYSSQSPHRLSPQSVRDVIDRLVKEHGSPNRIEVSVRAYATAFDDALGEHLLRLFPQEARSASPARQVSLLYRLLARLLPHYFPLASDPAPGRSEPTAEPAVSRREAVDMLQGAIELAARGYARQFDGAVSRILLSSHSAALHATLEPMMNRSQAETIQWLGKLLVDQKLAVSTNLEVRYSYTPRPVGDCTMPAGDSDLEANLYSNGHPCAQGLSRCEPDDGTTLYVDELEVTTDATLYCSDPVAPPGLCLRVVGTLTGDFPEAFEMRFPQLPARIDRSVLEAAGFGRKHADYLRLISRQHPLTVRQGPHGGLHLDADCAPDGSPLYHLFDTLAPMKGDWGTSQERTRVVFNRPDGVLDPRSGKRIPPLVVELALA